MIFIISIFKWFCNYIAFSTQNIFKMQFITITIKTVYIGLTAVTADSKSVYAFFPYDLAVGEQLDTVAEEMVAAMVDEDSELVSIYYGEDIDEEAAGELVGKLHESYPDIDVELNQGGQPIYYYIISAE